VTGPVRALLRRGLVRAGVVTYAFSALTLVANLTSGVISARALGPGGRGVTVALTTVSQLAGFLFAMGVAQSLSYFIARDPDTGPRLLTTWVLMLIPLTAVAIGISELLLPTIFPNNPHDAVEIGRWFLLTIALVVALELNYGLLLGKQDFFAYNVLRLAQPALMAAAFVVLWPLDALTVTTALIAPAAATALVLAIGMARSIGQIGFQAPDFRLGLHTLWFGVRGQGATVANHVTGRLDVAVLPAFVTAASVGLYSVATNVSLIIYQLANTFAALVLPAAAADVRGGARKVIGSFWAASAVAIVLAVGLAIFAEPLLGLVYGDAFRAADESLRLLLPGAVLFAGSSIIGAGVYAAGRPLAATLPQLLGMVVTLIGLFVFVPDGGITAAAIVSSVSYASVFVAMVATYLWITGIRGRELVPTRARLRELATEPDGPDGPDGPA